MFLKDSNSKILNTLRDGLPPVYNWSWKYKENIKLN